MKIHEILHTKGSSVVTISPDKTVAELVSLLRKHNLGAVIVSTNGSDVAGIVSERDVVRQLADGSEFLSSKVSSVMTSDVHSCTEGDSVESLMHTMTEERIRHLPVVDDDGSLQGIVSIGDVVKAHTTQLQFERDQLQGYVSG